MGYSIDEWNVISFIFVKREVGDEVSIKLIVYEKNGSLAITYLTTFQFIFHTIFLFISSRTLLLSVINCIKMGTANFRIPSLFVYLRKMLLDVVNHYYFIWLQWIFGKIIPNWSFGPYIPIAMSVKDLIILEKVEWVSAVNAVQYMVFH